MKFFGIRSGERPSQDQLARINARARANTMYLSGASVEDLQKSFSSSLSDQVLKSLSDIGHQNPSSGGGTFGPLALQSIEGTLSSATFDRKNELAFWNWVHKTKVYNTVHETPIIEAHGKFIEPFMPEGGVGVEDSSIYSKSTAVVKFLHNKRNPSLFADQANLAGGMNASARDNVAGTTQLLYGIERSSFFARESNNSTHYDGFKEQIRKKAPDNLIDMRGKVVTVELLHEAVAIAEAPPNFGTVDAIWVDAFTHKDLSSQVQSQARYDASKARVEYHQGGARILICGRFGDIPVKCSSFLQYGMPATIEGSGGDYAPSMPVLAANPTAVGTSSKFDSESAGDYTYRIVAVSDGGYSKSINTREAAVVSVAAGQSVQIDINDSTVTDGKYGVRYYRVYRSEKNGDDGSMLLIDEVPVNTDGAGGGTRIIDDGHRVHGSADIFLACSNPSVMSYVRFLELMKLPLGRIGASNPFLILFAGAPDLRVAKKVLWLENCGRLFNPKGRLSALVGD